MRGLRKRLVALTAVAAMVVTSFTGCAASVENSEVVATVGKNKITAGVANFYTRYQQATQGLESTLQMYANYGYDIKDMEVSYKEGLMTQLQELYILKDHMADYEVTLTDEDNAAIEKAADAFLKANSDEVKEKISAEKKYVVEVLELLTIQDKMTKAIKENETELVKEEDIAQKAMQYVLFSTSNTDSTTGESTEMTDDEKAEKKQEAEDFLAKAKENGNLEAYAETAELTAQKVTFDSENEAGLPDELHKVADELELNGFSDVIEIDSGYVVLQLTSLLDEDATNDKKYTEVVEIWKEDTEIKVYDKVWDKISLDKLGVTAKAEETESESDTTTDTTTDESADDAADDAGENTEATE